MNSIEGTEGGAGPLVTGLCGALFLLAALPTLIAAALPPSGLDGYGSTMFINDFAQYEAAMAEGGRSTDWRIHDHFTPELHEPALMWPLYVAVGKLSTVIGIPPILVYRAVELLSRAILLATIVWAASRLLSRPSPLAIVFASAGSGLGVWAALAQAAIGIPQPYGGNGSYEMNNYALLFAPPHVALGMAATLILIVMLVGNSGRWSGRRLLALVGANIALCLLHPFNEVSILVVAGALALIDLTRAGGNAPKVQDRTTAGDKPPPYRNDERLQRPSATPPIGAAFGLRSIAPLGLLVASGAPFVAYSALTFVGDPFWNSTYGTQNVLPSPAPHELIVDLGILMLVGIPAVISLWHRDGRDRRLAIALVIMLVLMYAPVPFQRRLAFGVAPLLGIVAGAAIGQFISVGGAARLPRLGGTLAAALTLGSPGIVYAGMLVSSARNEPLPVYRASSDLSETRRWLATSSAPTDVVLGSWDVMNYLAGAVPGRTVGGHPVATVDSKARKEAVDSLFRVDPSDASLRASLPDGGPLPRATLMIASTVAPPRLTAEGALIHRVGDIGVWRLSPAP
ncbi:MAG: putative rane protein [Chloroflexi bacterium]|nr:putative rane protein [Chloroflexota bacterium]